MNLRKWPVHTFQKQKLVQIFNYYSYDFATQSLLYSYYIVDFLGLGNLIVAV